MSPPEPATLPTVIATSVIRSAHQGQSHGGVFLIDLATGDHVQVIDWDQGSISWEGRGGDRGLRGIAFHRDRVFLSASDEIFVYDSTFRHQSSIKCRYLKHCHEICIHRDTLYATSTGYDAVLVFDLRAWRFTAGVCLRPLATGGGSRWLSRLTKATARRLRCLHPMFYRAVTRNLRARWFDPVADGGPRPFDLWHINNVSADDTGFYVSGAGLDGLFEVCDGRADRVADLPLGTHNACRPAGRLIYHDTERGRVGVAPAPGAPPEYFPLPHYPDGQLLNGHLRRDHARQRFGRGLCVDGDVIVAGSSPATVCAFAPGREQPLQSINLTLDLRNAIHGVEIWPFDRRLADWRTRCGKRPRPSTTKRASANPVPASTPAA